MTFVWPEPEPLSHSRAKRLEKGMRLPRQLENELDAFGTLEVYTDGSPAPKDDVIRTVGRRRSHSAVDADHIRPEVRQQHRGEGSRPDAGKFNNPVSGQRTAASACCLLTHLEC